MNRFTIVLGFACVILNVLLVWTFDNKTAMERENEKLKAAFLALRNREPGCTPAEEQRIICARKGGAVSILILGPKDVVVAGPLKTAPIKALGRKGKTKS